MKTINTYKKAILEKYKEGQSNYLKKLSPAKIRQDCVLKYQEGIAAKDKTEFDLFFEIEEEKNNLEKIKKIEEVDIDKFRPFKNFLTEKTSDTLNRNAELIAILVDFEPRPYRNYRKEEVSIRSEENAEREESKHTATYKEEINTVKKRVITEIESPQEEIERVPQLELAGRNKKETKNKEDKTPNQFSKNILVKAGSGIMAAAIVIMLTQNLISENLSSKSPNQCMVWSKTAYNLVPCYQINTSGRSEPCNSVIPYEKSKFMNFKKIAVTASYPFFSETGQPVVWYQKTGKYKVEFYSAPGVHPITCKTLRPVTEHIIGKYVPIHNISDSSLESLVQ